MLEKRIKSKELYLTILENIGDAVIVTDIDANIFFMNEVAESLTRWSKNDAIDKPI
jgi:PAS domain S-box-containing protein